MTNMECCFFCCDIISQENKNVDGESDELDASLNTFDCDTSTSKITDLRTTKENVLQISHYLKVPRTLVNDNESYISSIKSCQACTEISKYLSDYCSQLEVTQMKINHYLNQLTDRVISGISGDIEGKSEGPGNLSTFQKMFHKKCLLRVQNAENSKYPQICLKKCPNPSNLSQVPVPNLKLKEYMDVPDIPEQDELDHEIKIEDTPIISDLQTNDISSEELHSCPFCTFVVNGPYDELHSHISTEHQQHFQPDRPEEMFSIPVKTQEDDRSNETRDYSNLFKCNNCEKRFTQQGNLRRHLRKSLICTQGLGEHPSFWGNFECSNCKRRYARKDYLKYHIKTVCKTGIIIDYEKGKKVISLPKLKEKRTEKFTKCEFCGMLVYQKNLKRHINLKHANGNILGEIKKGKICKICGVPFGSPGNFRNHMLVTHGIDFREKVKLFGCKFCPKTFEFERSLKRHLENNETCRVGRNEVKVQASSQVENQKDEEPVLVLSIPEVNCDTDLFSDRTQLKVEEDPLKT